MIDNEKFEQPKEFHFSPVISYNFQTSLSRDELVKELFYENKDFFGSLFPDGDGLYGNAFEIVCGALIGIMFWEGGQIDITCYDEEYKNEIHNRFLEKLEQLVGTVSVTED